MRILVIDDMREFKSPPEDAAVVYAKTPKEGLRTLRTDKNWNQVYLGYELGYDLHGSADHIGPVIEYIEDHTDDFDSRTEFIVIASNNYAVNMMTRSLSVCGLKVARLDPYRQFHYVW